mgnify:CR=1 FL=1
MEVISNSVAALEACVGEDGLRVEFFRLADRYVHQIWRVRQSVRTELLLQSVDDPDAADADCLPALQGLNIEDLPGGGQAAALIGMSGSNHWSLTIEPQQQERLPTIVFDAACRVRNAPPRLTSRYLLEASLQTQGEGEQLTLAGGDASRLEIAACSIPGIGNARLTAVERQIDVTQTRDEGAEDPLEVRDRTGIALRQSLWETRLEATWSGQLAAPGRRRECRDRVPAGLGPDVSREPRCCGTAPGCHGLATG